MRTKILSLAFCLLMIMSLASCMGSSNANAGNKPEYKNDELKTLCTSLVNDKLIAETATVIESSQIGADEGYRFASSGYGNVEIYYFSDKNGDFYKQALDGKMNLFGTEYKAVLSKTKNCVLVYSTKVEETKKDDDLSKVFAEFDASSIEKDSATD